MDKSYFIFGIILLLLDIPFIIFVLKPKYNKINLALETNIVFAVIAYIIMISSWNIIKGDILMAAQIGLAIYGTYVFTLAAILPSYNLNLVITELIWGVFLFVISTILTNKLK